MTPMHRAGLTPYQSRTGVVIENAVGPDIYESRPGVTATADMGVLPGVLGPRSLQRTVHLRLGFEFLRLPGFTPIFTIL